MNLAELRSHLAQPSDVRKHGFSILQAISELVNSGHETDAREMVLRSLEKREDFGSCQVILDALVRETGLFPYATPDNLFLADSIAYEYHRPPGLDEALVFHREQAEVYRRILAGESIILSAPTSFGKSRIIDAVIATRHFRNIAVIVPTLALIDETRRRLSAFSAYYKIVTQVSQEPREMNIFVFTAERANVYEQYPQIDLVVVDEFYKIGALSEDKRRTVALNQAFYKLIKGGAQFYMLGPCVKEIPKGLEKRLRCSFYPTDFATVVSEEVSVSEGGDDLETLRGLCQGLSDPTLIFCRSPKRVNEVARTLVDGGIRHPSEQSHAAHWIAEHFHPKWIMANALDKGIGIHHGKLPRSLGQYVVRAFNDEKLRFLICTSTLIEGVNTKAKNVIILDNVIAREKYDYFTFNNIKGRSGRMFHHFIGRVFLFHSPPQAELPFVDFPMYSQGPDTPESILLQMEEADLSARSRERTEKYASQDILPLDLLKQNPSVEPSALLELATAIWEMSTTDAKVLSWRRAPDYHQLETCCELIWNHLVERAHASVYSGKQLALKTTKLRLTPAVDERIAEELLPGKYAASTADEAVERVLEFDRTWASFELPLLLKALSDVQYHVLNERGMSAGNYAWYIGQLENLFRDPFQLTLEEYGLPIQVTDKLQKHLGKVQSVDEILGKIKRLDARRILSDPFEIELLQDCQPYL